MKKVIKGILILSFISSLGVWFHPGLREAVGLTPDDTHLIRQAYEDRLSNIVVEAEATVRLLLPDVDDRRDIQVFVIELENGHQLHVIHDLDVAPSVPIGPGAIIRLRGEYDWTSDGGVIHWTHADPAGHREGGWIEVEGKKYF